MTTTAPATALHYAPNANLADGSFNAAGDPGSIGFNLADVSSQSSADALPAGDQGLLWIGSDSIAQAESIVAATANDPKIYGYYVADEPADSAFPTIKTIDQYISAHAAGKVSFIVAENEGSYQSPDITATPANTGADLVGLDPYPIQGQFSGGQDLAIIPAYVQSAEAGGWQQSQIVPVYQAFGGGGYSQWTLPTAVQEDQILATWSTLTPNPAFDSAYSWGTQDNDNALTNTPSLQAVFQQLFEGSGGGSPASAITNHHVFRPIIGTVGGERRHCAPWDRREQHRCIRSHDGDAFGRQRCADCGRKESFGRKPDHSVWQPCAGGR